MTYVNCVWFRQIVTVLPNCKVDVLPQQTRAAYPVQAMIGRILQQGVVNHALSARMGSTLLTKEVRRPSVYVGPVLATLGGRRTLIDLRVVCCVIDVNPES